jgi:hypothetical protein
MYPNAFRKLGMCLVLNHIKWIQIKHLKIPHIQHAEPKSKAQVLEEAWFKCLQARQKLGIMIPKRPRPATPSKKAKGEVKRKKKHLQCGGKKPFSQALTQRKSTEHHALLTADNCRARLPALCKNEKKLKMLHGCMVLFYQAKKTTSITKQHPITALALPWNVSPAALLQIS